MPGRLGRFQVTPTFTAWKGITRENHIASVYGSKPQNASELMVQLWAAQRGKTLESLLSKFPKKMFETDDEYTWPIIGSSRRNIPIIEARDKDGNVVTSGMVGVGVEPFYVVFGEDWFADGEVIVGEKNEVYPLRILANGWSEGTNTVYKVELMGGVLTGMPAEELTAGKLFSIEYAPVERDFSRRVGDARFAAPTAMRNEFTTIRISKEVGGKMLNKKVAIGIPVVKDGKKFIIDRWMHYEDFAVEEQFSDYKNNALAFGRSNRTAEGEYKNIGKSGGVIQTGAGLFEQMEVANTIYYNNFSLKLIEEVAYELLAAKTDIKNKTERHLIMITGERGAVQFHKAVTNEVSGWGVFTINGDAVGAVKKVTSELHENALQAGFQFTDYLMPNGVRLTVQIDPYYDDTVRNKIQHPNGGPAFSYRYDIFDMGTPEQPNIFRVGAQDEPEMRGYEWGPFRNPWTGKINNDNASFGEDKAIIHKKAVLGICVLDPTRTMSLIPNILSA